MGRGWNKLPKNKTDVKVKIVERLLAFRKLINNEYILDQSKIILILSNVWYSVLPPTIISHNDRVRLFSIVTTIEENRFVYQRLSEGYTCRQSINDTNFSPRQIFSNIASGYNNEKIKTDLTGDIFDVDGHKEIDPNDKIRITITRDGG